MATARQQIISTNPDPGLVLARALARAADMLQISGTALARIIGASEATVSRVLRGQRRLDPQTKEGELALLVIRLFRSLDALVGNDAGRRLAWMGSFNHGLGGKPRELMLTAEGLCAVVAYLDGMRARS